MEQEEHDEEEVDRAREDESGNYSLGSIHSDRTCLGKSPDSLLEDGCGGQTSGSRGCGGQQPKHHQHRHKEHNQIQPGNTPQGKSVKSQPEGNQHILGPTKNGEASNRLALLQASTHFEGQPHQESSGQQSYQSQSIQVQQLNKFSKCRYSQDQVSQQSKGESYRDTSSGQSSMDTYDAQTSEEARPSPSQNSSSPKEWFSSESEGFGKSSPIGDICLKPASVVSREKGMETIRRAAKERTYWCSTPPAQSSDALDLPHPSLLGEVDTRNGSSVQAGGKEERKEDDLIPTSAFCLTDIGLRRLEDAKTGTLRPKKRKKGKSEAGSANKGGRENSKQCAELTEKRSEMYSPAAAGRGEQKENEKGSRTGTLRPKKGRLKVLAPGGVQEEEAIKRGMESGGAITGDVLGEQSNKISVHSKSNNKLVSEVDSEVSKSNTLSSEISSSELPGKGLKEAEKETNLELDWGERARMDENNDVLKISMDWREGNFLNEENSKVSDLSFLKAKTVRESRQDQNKALQENNMQENAERCSGEDMLNPARESGEKSLEHNSAKQTDTDVKAVTADEGDIRTDNTEVKADDTDVKASATASVVMDTLLSISEVSHE